MAIGMASGPEATPSALDLPLRWSFTRSSAEMFRRPLLKFSVYESGGRSLDSPFMGTADGAIVSGRGEPCDIPKIWGCVSLRPGAWEGFGLYSRNLHGGVTHTTKRTEYKIGKYNCGRRIQWLTFGKG
ncbi:hypothetical protein VTL71DRAFT_9385 [Oculimacula yallundae]|uniref:Uncharacterized protein n=1 Tax=Oculimacula yallundae TaxID=86028 RepID=A0ABR4BVJ8_9HELO